MKSNRLSSPDVLRRLLTYVPETGRLFWKKRAVEFVGGDKASLAKRQANVDMWNRLYAGQEAFTANENGYRAGAVLGVPCKAHRVAYAIYHGEHPPAEIDHINGDKADNRIKNLRAVNHGENAKNTAIYSNNRSGTPGVCWCSYHKSWDVKIGLGGRQVRIGRFKDKDDAVAARKKAEMLHGYHPNHGRVPA